jgi:predicted site-specific integrase-resolvase
MKYYTPRQAGTKIGRKRETIINYIRSGKIKYSEIPSNNIHGVRYLISEDNINEFLGGK